MYNYPRIPIYTPPSFSWPLPGHALYSVVLRTISCLIQVDFYGDFILLFFFFFQLCRANRFGREKKKKNWNINHGYRAPPSIDGFEVMPRTNPNLLFVTSLTFISMIEAVLKKMTLSKRLDQNGEESIEDNVDKPYKSPLARPGPSLTTGA